MKQLTISYLDHFLHIHCALEMGSTVVPQGYRSFTDDDLGTAFDTLVAGYNVWVWYSHDFRRIITYLMSHYQYVKAAGGVVSDPMGQRLLIQREGNWDIPKGMVEPGESISQAALREVCEETGITDLSLGHLLLKTYHIYDKYGGWHLKQTSWFEMSTPHASPTLPQQEEGITQAVWVAPTVCRQRLSQSFASLQLLSNLIN